MPGRSAGRNDECVKVVVRVRPLSHKEVRDGHEAVAQVSEDSGMITLRNPRSDDREPPKSFTFDHVFGPNCTQRSIYDSCAAAVVDSVLQGYNGTIFAYGQTGAGKTHTMEGVADPPDLRGIIPNSFEHIFDAVSLAESGEQFLVRASYLEIYNEEIRDLLRRDARHRALELKENVDTGVYVKDLSSTVVKSTSEIDQVMQAGKQNRSTGATRMNATSSRSHSIFTVIIECASTDERGEHIRVGRLNMVDLAGSERQSKTGATGDRLKEATKINLSLSALGNVISALVDGRSQHIPYRDSKLTRLLQDSLGGNTKTIMCANCGPAGYNYDETLSTLRYANRAKNIKNKPKINEDPKDAMLREFQDEIKRLKAQLEGQPVYDENGNLLEVREKVVERVVQVGVSEEEMQRLRKEAEAEREALQKRAEAEREMVQKQSEAERRALRERLEEEERERKRVEEQKASMQSRLQFMEQKLIQGGEMMDKARRQEAELRMAKREIEERKRQEVKDAEAVEKMEREFLEREEQFDSLQEEVEVKTKKLRKLWNKYQAASSEIRDLEGEFQREREDMLDTIRELTKQLKLKDLVIASFIPPPEAQSIEARSLWNAEAESWSLPNQGLAANVLRATRRQTSANGLLRPETEYARQRKQYDTNPRYRHDNIINMEMDMPERTTQEFEGPGMTSRVTSTLMTPLDVADEEVVFEAVPNTLGSPYLQ